MEFVEETLCAGLNSSKRVILVNPPPDYDREAYKKFDISMAAGTPFGLLLLGTILSEKGFSVRILDGQICDCEVELKRELEKSAVLCVGVSVMTSQVETASSLSTWIKNQKSDIPVVWGGFHPSILPEEVACLPFVDYSVCGEADVAFLQLCMFLSEGGRLGKIGNLVYLRDKQVCKNESLPLSSFDTLPELDWELLDDVKCYVKKRNALGQKTQMISVLAGLGCDFACAFCHNAIYRKYHRTKTAKALIDEMNRLHESYGVTEFGLADENFFGDRERLYEFLGRLEGNKYSFRWSSTLRASYATDRYLNKEMLQRISQSGGYYFGVGAESGSRYILKKLHKGILPKQVLSLAEKTRNIDISLAYSFIAGIPGESIDMTLETLRFIEKIKKINPRSLTIGPQIFRPYPGSPLADEAFKIAMEKGGSANFSKEALSRFRQIDINDLPWLSDPLRFKYMLLSFFVLQMRMNKGRIINVGIIVLQLLSRFRLKMGWYRLMLERPLLEYINRKLT